MKKIHLKSYSPEIYQALNNNGYTYNLNVLKVYLWGLIKKESIINYTVPIHCNLKSYTDHWDSLIKYNKEL